VSKLRNFAIAFFVFTPVALAVLWQAAQIVA
jgi:hypothetical protein